MTSREDLEAAEIVTVEWFDFVSMAKIVDKKLNPLLGTTSITMTPYQDTIHPYPLAFEPPLIEHASQAGTKGFRHRWEKLAYAFDLPDPTKFTRLPTLSDEDRLIGSRFVKVCRRLAAYSAINADSRLRLFDHGDVSTVELDYPSDEAFSAAALAFRQLHSGNEDAPFDKVKGRLFQALKDIPASERKSANATLQQWVSARGKLMNQLLETIVCRKAAPRDGPSDFPYSYNNIKPEELILTFQYGDVIHFSGERENLAALMEEEANEHYYKYAVLLAITGLSHLYFGFALLVEAAMSD